ncbi:MAG: hypothetical protein IJH50_09685 [Kiritimatiellae bacterium]|nr:hypothetical protein [Kiritimatiellia bacterium]
MKNMLHAVVAAALVVVFAVSSNATTYTSASYVQNGLIAQWDGIDNAGTGTHDPTTNIWKDLRGSLDMTLTDKGSWTADGNALFCNNGAGAQGASATPAYKTIEIVYKMTWAGGRILFSSGIATRFAVFDNDGTRLYFDGEKTTKTIVCTHDPSAICFTTATYDDSSTVSNLYFNGNLRNDDIKLNTWGTGDGKVAVGDRSLSASYPWIGEVYAIRLYDRVLTAEEIALNCAIDKARFMPSDYAEDDSVTSSSYVQDGLMAQWDGIDNQGTGTHDPTATTWKDLAGNNDLTIVGGLHAEGRNAEWRRGIALYFNNVSLGKAAVCGVDGIVPKYKTIEVVYKMTSRSARILFWGGDRSRYVLFDHNVDDPFSTVYFDGREITRTDRTFWAKVKSYDPTSAVATYDDNDNVTDVFIDGAGKSDNRQYNTWGAGDNRVTLGWRSVDTAGTTYGWEGEVYAIRLYNRVLTPEEIAKNHAIDVKRFFTSAMYDTTGMVSFWDAKDNAGTGTHSPAATTWKNLVPGGQDMTVDTRIAQWTAGAMLCNDGVTNDAGIYRPAAYGTAPLEYSSLEVVFRNERLNGTWNAWLLSNGIDRYCVLAGNRTMWQNYIATYAMDSTQGGNHSLSWVRRSGESDADAVPYVDGEKKNYESYGDYWGVGDNVVHVGGRTGSYSFSGRIYSVRAYSSQLSTVKVYENRKIDEVRYANSKWWSGGDGSFGTVGNWRSVDVAKAVPGTESTVELPYGTYTISLDRDRTVGAMRARNGHVYYFPTRLIDATVDMGGHKLTLMGSYRGEARSGYNDRRFARLSLTNGTFQSESIRIGDLADRIVDNVTWKDYEDALKYGSGTFCVEGPDTTATIRKDVALEGPCTTLRVAGGATFSCSDLRMYSTKNRLDSYPSGKYDRALAEFTGAGTTATLGKFCGYNDVDVVVSNGASVAVNASTEYFSAAECWISSIGRSFEGLPGSGSIVVDDATLTMKSTGFAVGVTYLASGSGNSSMTLRNNATLTLTGMSRFFVGVGANDNRMSETGCFLNVLSGSTLDGGSTQLEVGPVGNTSFSGINVDNATVNCGVIYLGSKSSETCSSNDLLHVSGAAPRINLASEASTSLQLRMGTRLKFTIPENGFAATPIVTAGGVHVESDEAQYAVDPVKLVIDASAFKGDRQTLVKTATDSTAAFQKLIGNINFVGRKRGLLTIEAGGTELVYSVPGALLIIR